MIAAFSLLLVVTLSLLVTRIATVALTLTGLSQESAKFQARSAFTGVGFTTDESESIVNHPVRRKIVMLLMLLGNLGIASVVATSIVSYMNITTTQYGWLGIVVLIGGISLLWILIANRRFEKWLNIVILKGLKRWAKLNIQDYVAILHLQNDYAVTELVIEQRDWLNGKTLLESALSKEGVLVLGIQRKEGVYLGAPRAETIVEANDTLVLYGPVSRLEELDRRRKGRGGERAHEEAMKEFDEIVEEEQLQDEQRFDDD